MPAATKLTYADYAALPDDGKRYELIDGELVVNPAPVPRHQFIVRNVLRALDNYFHSHGGGKAVASPIDVVFADETVVQPDVIAIKTDRLSIIGPKNIQGAPHLVVEVLSDGTRRHDEIDKRKIYERFGVDEYWIVDAELELVKIYRSSGDSFSRISEVSTEAGGSITTPLLPDFDLPIADVFET
jgi:Uma2 family endonuclease